MSNRASVSERPTSFGAATAMLARRDLSEGEVRARLRERDYAEEEIETAIRRLHERRYLDDRALAGLVARRRAERQLHGPLQVSAHLRKRQISEELAREAVREAFPNGAESERAALALERIVRRRPASRTRRNDEDPRAEARRNRERLLRRLLARGFSREAAYRAVAEHPSGGGGETGEEAGP